jgi:hypothetical protein
MRLGGHGSLPMTNALAYRQEVGKIVPKNICRSGPWKGCRDTQHNDTQHNGIQHNDTQHSNE